MYYNSVDLQDVNWDGFGFLLNWNFEFGTFMILFWEVLRVRLDKKCTNTI